MNDPARERAPTSGVHVRLSQTRAHGFEVRVSLRDGTTYDVWVPRSVAERSRAALLERAELLATSGGRGVPRDVGVHVLALLCAYGESGAELSFVARPSDGWSGDTNEFMEVPTERYSEVPTGSIDPPPAALVQHWQDASGILNPIEGGRPAPLGAARGRSLLAPWWFLLLVALAAFVIGVAGAIGFGVVHARP